MGGGGRGRAIFRHRLWQLLLGIGLLSSFLGIFVDTCIGFARDWRHGLLEMTDSSLWRLVLWVSWSVSATCLAVLLTRASTEAQGSGIPQMKVILAGGISATHAESYLSVRCLLIKMAGLVLGKAGGLSIGKEGPWVHISAALAHVLSRCSTFAHLSSEKDHWREIISAGFAAGTAANFGAPIGGVLFSIEVTATHYPVSSYLKAFVCSVSGAFCFRLLGGTGTGPWSQYNGGALFSRVDEDGDIRVFQHERHELIAFSVLGVIAGLLGSGFVSLHRFMLLHRRECWSGSTYRQPVCVAIITALMTFPDVMGDFMYMGDNALVEDMLSPRDLHETQHVNGQHWGTGVNLALRDDGDAAAHATLAAAVDTEEQELAEVTSAYAAARVPHALATLIVVRFFLTAMCITLPVPCGVFMPVFVVGCALGRLYGYYVSILLSSNWWTQGTAQRAVLAGSYAVAGGAAFSAGVTRAVSTAVFVFEMTGQLHQLVPVLLSVIIAIGVGNLHTPSIYNSLLELNRLPYFYNLPSATAASAGGRPWGALASSTWNLQRHESTGLKAEDLMSRLVRIDEMKDHSPGGAGGGGEIADDAGGTGASDKGSSVGDGSDLRLEYESLPLRPTASQVATVRKYGTLPLVAVVDFQDSDNIVLVGVISRGDLDDCVGPDSAPDLEAPAQRTRRWKQSEERDSDGNGEDERMSLLAQESSGQWRDADAGKASNRLRQLMQGTTLHSVATHTSVGQLQLYFSRLGVDLAYVVSAGVLKGVVRSQQVALQPPA